MLALEFIMWLQDVFLHYKAMNGFSCYYRNGFDARGLWVEVEVEKELAPELFTLATFYKNEIIIAERDCFSMGLNTALDDDLIYEGLYRELLRHCQVLRKEAGLNVDEQISLAISSDSKLINVVLGIYKNDIMNETLSTAVDYTPNKSKYEKEVILGDCKVLLQIKEVYKAN